MSLLIATLKHGRAGSAVGPVHSIAYHRNGIGGLGFYAVEFTLNEAPRPRLLAIVPTDTTQADELSREAFTVQPDKPGEGWRGSDHFNAALREVIRAAKWPHEVEEQKRAEKAQRAEARKGAKTAKR